MKLPAKIIVLAAIVMLCVVSMGAASDYTEEEGDYNVIWDEDVDPFQPPDLKSEWSYEIFRPNPLVSGHPIAVFCVGANGNPENGASLFASLASHGIVVIAGNDSHQREGDQALAGLNWLISQNGTAGSVYEGKLNTEKTMSFGFSEGGNAALWVAVKGNQQESDKIDCVIAMAPGVLPEYGRFAPAAEINVPTLYTSGSLDWTVPSQNVLNHFWNVLDDDSPAWYAEKRWVLHLTTLLNPTINDYIRAWAYAHLYSDTTAQQEFYGPNWGMENDSQFRDQRRNLQDPF